MKIGHFWRRTGALFFAFILMSRVSAAPHDPRVVSMTPNVTEIILALGATNSLVGVSDYCQLPEGVSEPRCGGLLNPNFERILALHPTLLFVLGRMDRVRRFAENNEIQCLSVTIESFHELTEETIRVGDLLGKGNTARALVAELQVRLDAVRKRSASLPAYKALALLDGEAESSRSLMAAGKNSFISEMMEAAHGVNIFSEQRLPYFIPSRESILALQPDAIFEFRGSVQGKKDVPDWLSTADTPASHHHRIVYVTEDFATIPGPRMVQIAEWFEACFRKFSEEDRKTP